MTVRVENVTLLAHRLKRLEWHAYPVVVTLDPDPRRILVCNDAIGCRKETYVLGHVLCHFDEAVVRWKVARP